LTQVSNRRALDETLESMCALLNRYNQPFAIAILDIDHFKRINDERGHLQGDRALKMVARVIGEQLRDTDTVARFGGDEFIVVMPHTDLEGAFVLAERLRKQLEETGQSSSLTLTGGVSLAVEGDDPQTLLARADAALYAAKSAGRNRIFCHVDGRVEPGVGEAETVLS
jgi:diguanylate cyclase (GGDEF)-like protein